MAAQRRRSASAGEAWRRCNQEGDDGRSRSGPARPDLGSNLMGSIWASRVDGGGWLAGGAVAAVLATLLSSVLPKLLLAFARIWTRRV